jgi:hypothetical protein
VQAISELDGVDEHHPDVDVRYDGVLARLIRSADDWHGISTRDVDLVRRIPALARDLGVEADPSAVRTRHRPTTEPVRGAGAYREAVSTIRCRTFAVIFWMRGSA